MKTAGAIVTDHGGRTCHAAIVARELGVPAVVGAGNATTDAADRRSASRSPAPAARSGAVYAGERAVRGDARRCQHARDCRRPQIMVNLGNPDLAFRTAMMPNAGVGLARMEFIINEHIGVHPMALVHPERVTAEDRARIAALAAPIASPREFFVRTLAEGVGTIAAAFYPKPVIVRLSDFKTNEYAAADRRRRVRAARKPTRCSASAARRATRIRPMPRASRWNARRCAGCARTWG